MPLCFLQLNQLHQGKKANEAGYLVGYNSPAQPSSAGSTSVILGLSPRRHEIIKCRRFSIPLTPKHN